jgi:hypothetical protein
VQGESLESADMASDSDAGKDAAINCGDSKLSRILHPASLKWITGPRTPSYSAVGPGTPCSGRVVHPRRRCGRRALHVLFRAAVADGGVAKTVDDFVRKQIAQVGCWGGRRKPGSDQDGVAAVGAAANSGAGIVCGIVDELELPDLEAGPFAKGADGEDQKLCRRQRMSVGNRCQVRTAAAARRSPPS